MDAATETIIKMIEPLTEETKNRLVDELRSILCEMNDEALWQDHFSGGEKGLIVAAKVSAQ